MKLIELQVNSHVDVFAKKRQEGCVGARTSSRTGIVVLLTLCMCVCTYIHVYIYIYTLAFHTHTPITKDPMVSVRML